MSEIKGIDISKWQSELSDATVANMVQAGIQFAYVKAGQGSASQDIRYEHNVMVLMAAGMKVGAYHFVTNDNASQQTDNFLAQLSKFPVWQLPPALDCEAYTQTSGRLEMSVRDMAYGLSYPSQAIVDAIGRSLTQWMTTQPTLVDYVYPVIYTNASSGNKIFTSATMARYLLWVANWNSPGKPPLVAPAKPAVWKNVPHFIWQYAVQDGADFGDAGTQYDRDRWGTLMPFPDDEPEPPPPEEDTIEVTIRQDGKIYTGTLEAK